VRRKLLLAHQLDYCVLLSEIMEIETLGLAVLIVRNGQVSDGLGLYRDALGIAWLFTLRFTLRLFSPLLLPRPFFLSLSKGCTRASCHSCFT
jgi:hypothetical protein